MIRVLTPPRAFRAFLGVGALLFGGAALHAQDDGLNFHVLSNPGTATYLGIGAGSGSTPGVDVAGYWIGGEDMQGATLTQLTVGGAPQFGYKQSGQRITACVFNLGANSRLDFPAMLTVELDDSSMTDGFNFHHPFNFLRPGCGVGTANPGVAPITTNAFGAPTGAPPGASFQWLVLGLPTGLGISTGAVLLSPNGGLVPSSSGTGTLTLVSAASLTAAISATGCYNVDINWTAATGSALPALDDVGGWWTQFTASRDNNQYWSLALDNLNVVKSRTAFTSGGATAVFGGLATLELEALSLSLDPSTNLALAPTSPATLHPYYSTGAPGTGNQGFDLGPAGAVTATGLTGAFTVFNGAGGPPPGTTAQDLANATLNIGPMPTGGAMGNSIGFVTWNNNTYASPGSGVRLTWVQADLDLLGGGTIDPASQTSVLVFGGNVRVPVRIPVLPGAWPQPLTQTLFPLLQHATADETGNGLWPDPSGNAGGALGVPPIVGQSLHLPIAGLSGTCAFGGLPIGISYGSTGLTGLSTGPLVWDPQENRVSSGRSVLLYD